MRVFNGLTSMAVIKNMNSVGFVEDGKAAPSHPVSTLSEGWRINLVLTGDMFQDADILLLMYEYEG